MLYRRTGYSLQAVAGLISLFLGGCGAAINVSPLVPEEVPGLQATANRHDDDYRVEPGDTLKINFPYHPEMNQEEIIQPNGTIVAHSIGETEVAGLTIREIRRLLIKRTSQYLRDPEVVVSIARFAEKSVYVTGEVDHPKAVRYQEGLTPLQAIAEAGGFLDTARIDSVILIRSGRNEEDSVSRKLDLAAVMNEGANEPLRLAPRDVLFVPKTPIANANVWVRQHIYELIPIRPPSTRFPGQN